MNDKHTHRSAVAGALAAIALAPLLVTAGCATAPKQEVFFPPPPDAPRYSYVRSFTSPKELQPSLISRIIQFLVPHESKSLLAAPYGIALSPDEKTLYVAATVIGKVFAIDLESGEFRSLKAGPGPGLARPLGVAVDAAGKIYVGDRGASAVFVFGPNLKLERKIQEKLFQPSSVAVDREAQLLYVVNDPDRKEGTQSVEVYTLGGEHLRTLGGHSGIEDGFFALPSGVSVSPKGEVYVSDRLSGRIQVFDREGRFVRKFGEGGTGRVGLFDKPYGVAFDSFGNVYVADATQGLHILNEDYLPLMPLNGGLLGFPAFIAISSTNRIYVTDNTRYCVHELQLINTTAEDSRRRSKPVTSTPPATAPEAPAAPPASPSP
jgi:DNA-binding beta-propeller fold protein YncE